MKIDETEVRKAITLMKPDNELYEIRIMQGKKVYSGYFRGADQLIKELDKYRDNESNVYITLNKPKDACYDRKQHESLIMDSKSTTSDNDVERYEWLMVDLDPKRPTDTSSSDSELKIAKNMANKIYTYLNDMGFEKPLMAESGNGCHLLYRIDLSVEDGKPIAENCLKALDLLFSVPEVEVDRKNFNPARICKLYGTFARKGSSTIDRPHRMSRIISNYQIKVTERKYLEKLCKTLPAKSDAPQKFNGYSPKDFDLDEWLDKHLIRYEKVSASDYTKYILEQCPFDSNHKGKDACLIKGANGAIGFHCFHNSCSGHTWQDFRLMYEPDAYDKKNQDWNRKAYETHNRDIPKIVEKEGSPVFYTAEQILKLPKPEETFIKTGFIEIDRRLRGLKKTFVTVLSGLRGASKSTVLSEISLNAIDTGNNVGMFSGEMSEKNVLRWMNLQAAGKGYVEPGKYEGYYNVPIKTQNKIAKWLGDHFWLYNNDYGSKYEAIESQLEKKIDECKLDLLILDNLMAFDIRGLSQDKFEAQTQFVLRLHDLAKKKNVHIIFVAHPRKALGFLRLDDISGTADLANAVDNAFIVHRVNNDFIRLTGQMYGWKEDNFIYSATNVIEIAKDRDGGTQDVFVPLWYEPETKRLKNSPAESIVYGWNTELSDLTEPTPFDMTLNLTGGK